MTQAVIHRSLPTSEVQKTDNLVTLPKDIWIPEQVTAEEERENSTPKVFLIDTLENKNLAREAKIIEELNEVREEVKETCEIDSDVSPVPEQAYEETITLLKQMHHDIPIPDMMWLEDGGIGLEWRPRDGIVTMSLYGDEHVTFVAIVEKQHKIAGTCPLSDQFLLPNFLASLPTLFQPRM